MTLTTQSRPMYNGAHIGITFEKIISSDKINGYFDQVVQLLMSAVSVQEVRSRNKAY